MQIRKLLVSMSYRGGGSDGELILTVTVHVGFVEPNGDLGD